MKRNHSFISNFSKNKRFISLFPLLFFLIGTLFAEDYKAPKLQATSSINWITRDFKTNITLNTKEAEIEMPTGKKTASNLIIHQMPVLIQPPLLSLFCNANENIENKVVQNQLSLEQVYNFILSGYKSNDVFSPDLKYLKTTNTININELSKDLVRHNQPYTPDIPIDTVPSRKYSGIIIDARGANPVHGEYIESDTYPCLFPKIWDEQMEVVYEKNLAIPEIVKDDGLVSYHYSDDIDLYEDRVGADPLYIKATEVYGRNRTDPIIKKKDALKILTIPENIQLLKEGKIVILLDKDNLIYDIAVPEKTPAYYIQFNNVKRYFYENKVPNVTISETTDGILFSVDLNFYPDSPELLPSENERIHAIAECLKELLMDDGYTILVEGHTADVGKPVGQLNLSIERTRTVMNALIDEGIEEKLFTYKGYGGTMPLATNETEEGRAQNRRVDITARPRATYIQRDW